MEIAEVRLEWDKMLLKIMGMRPQEPGAGWKPSVHQLEHV